MLNMNLLAWVTDIPTKCIALGTWDQPGNHYIIFSSSYVLCMVYNTAKNFTHIIIFMMSDVESHK